MGMELIRNFSIIAHIDHGKSTLADRFIQRCGGLSEREMAAQVLDSMDLERERGITIKAQSVSLNYEARDGKTYTLNFIDTPGHVDFSYEVSRSLAACEGALLIVDASQGVEAQSVANCYTAIDLDLEVLPVLNKIDLPAADPQRVKAEIEEIIGLDTADALEVSAKTGSGVEDLLEQIIERIPPPRGAVDNPTQALIIDSWFDPYVGVITLVRVVEGAIAPRQKIRMMSSGREFAVEKVGVFTPKREDRDVLDAGNVGYIIAGIKDIESARVGDTVTLAQKPAVEPLPDFKQVQRLDGGLLRQRNGIAHARRLDVLDTGNNVTDITGVEHVAILAFGRKHADFFDRKFGSARHHADFLARRYRPFDHPHQRDDADVGIEPGIDDQCLGRIFDRSSWRRDTLDNLLQQILDTAAGLGADLERIGRVQSNDFLDLGLDPVRVRGGQIDLVQHRHHLEIEVDRGITIGHALRLDALRGIDDQQGPFTGRQRARYFIGKVDVTGCVDEI